MIGAGKQDLSLEVDRESSRDVAKFADRTRE